jgi:glycosyltransferase involved in cell wall biosynthesis
MIEISAVIPTRNRATFVERCLQSLCSQTLDPARYEIIMVDNGSTDNTAEIVSAFAARNPDYKIILVSEPQAGVARARNLGFRKAHGALIAMGDDDATMPPDWLERYITRFAEFGEDVVLIGGEVIPDWQAPRPDWLTPRMMGILSAASEIGSQPRFVEPPQNVFEGNCCYRRRALECVGGFPVELGRVGNCLLSGEGYMNMVIARKVGRIFFDPAITIRHTIHADRMNPMWFRRRYFWQGISGYVAHLYYQKSGLSVANQLNLDLPLAMADWAFVNKDTAEGLETNLNRLEHLGFVLAMSGIIPVEGV